MTARESDTPQTGDRLPGLDLPLDDRWHEDDGTVSLRAGPRRAALLLYLPHGVSELAHDLTRTRLP